MKLRAFLIKLSSTCRVLAYTIYPWAPVILLALLLLAFSSVLEFVDSTKWVSQGNQKEESCVTHYQPVSEVEFRKAKRMILVKKCAVQ